MFRLSKSHLCCEHILHFFPTFSSDSMVHVRVPSSPAPPLQWHTCFFKSVCFLREQQQQRCCICWGSMCSSPGEPWSPGSLCYMHACVSCVDTVDLLIDRRCLGSLPWAFTQEAINNLLDLLVSPGCRCHNAPISTKCSSMLQRKCSQIPQNVGFNSGIV